MFHPQVCLLVPYTAVCIWSLPLLTCATACFQQSAHRRLPDSSLKGEKGHSMMWENSSLLGNSPSFTCRLFNKALGLPVPPSSLQTGQSGCQLYQRSPPFFDTCGPLGRCMCISRIQAVTLFE
eukprot:s1944_g14.t1